MLSFSGELKQDSVKPSNYTFINAEHYFKGCDEGTITEETSRQAFKNAPALFSSIYDTLTTSTTHSIDDLEQALLGIEDKKDDKRRIMHTLRCTYSDTNPSPFSLDLLQAVERQHVVGSRMLRVNWILPDSVVRGLRNYKNFLLLMKNNRGLIGVPTLEIDVSWHTHQLHPVDYRRFTSHYMGRVINHDDTIPQYKLGIYSNHTKMAWEKKTPRFEFSVRFLTNQSFFKSPLYIHA
jgi:hypothetical protein